MARLSKKQLKDKGIEKYQKVLKNGKIQTDYLTIEEALSQHYCGICKSFVGETTEFYSEPLEGLCDCCRGKLEKILSHFECRIDYYKSYASVLDCLS